MPSVAAVKIAHAGLDRAVTADLLQEAETTNDTPISSSHWMFCVTRARLH